MTDPNKLLSDVRTASKRAKAEQTAAREAVIPAIRAMEAELVQCLHNDNLRGLKNLGLPEAPLYAARLRGNPDTPILWPAEANASGTSLIVSRRGNLSAAVALTDAKGEMLPVLAVRAVQDDELMVEDLQELLQTLMVVIPRHIESAGRAAEKYAQLSALSDRIMLLLGEGR